MAKWHVETKLKSQLSKNMRKNEKLCKLCLPWRWVSTNTNAGQRSDGMKGEVVESCASLESILKNVVKSGKSFSILEKKIELFVWKCVLGTNPKNVYFREEGVQKSYIEKTGDTPK